MAKKTEEPVTVKPLKAKLFESISKVLKSNQAILTDKMENIVKKSVKRIARKAKKQAKNESKLK